MGKVVSTIVLVLAAVAISGGIWVGANAWFSLVRNRWQAFQGITYGVLGAFVGILLHGNRILSIENEGFLNWVWPPLVIAALSVAIGVTLAAIDDPAPRLAVAVGGFGAVGVVLGLFVDRASRPELDLVALVVWTLVGVAAGVGLALARRRAPLASALVLGSLGWIIGSWGAATLGTGTTAEAVLAMAVPAVALGAWRGLTPNPDRSRRVAIDQKSRPIIFLGPALLFITATLLIPAIRTLYLSFFDRRSDEWVGLANYTATFTDPVSFDGSNWANTFGSRLFWIGAVLLVIAAIVGAKQKRETGRAVELGNPTSGPLAVGAVLVLFAVFTAFRGTVINNLWWVLVVTLFSTALGLAVAVLADGVAGEKAAKSIVFMPMAISLVGASIIWRFMYVPRNPGEQQTGVMNALWVGLGNLSTGSGIPTVLVGVVAVLALLGLLVAVARALTRQRYASAVVPGVAALLVGWFAIRYWGIIGTGVGGHRIRPDGSIIGEPILFIQESPYNNFWLMVILVWIQTGFAMVILSAAIRAVPDEFIEAARVDGATSTQIFWRIILPQIATTIGVVVTTTIVLVMKVFDIVKVVTNGNFGTQVLANDMFQQAFINSNIGRGAALAVLILVSVVPVMYVNVKRMQEEH